MRSTVLITTIAICLAAAACGNDSADSSAGDLLEMDTAAGGVSVPPAAEVGTSPDEDVDSNAGRAGATAGADGTAEDRAPAPPSGTPDRADDAGRNDAATIPAPFHGEWNAERAACGTGRSETRLRISASEVRFYESVGAVQSVEIESDRVIEVTAEYQGEGDTWRDERRMTLSEDGSSLTVSNGGDLVRYRCP